MAVTRYVDGDVTFDLGGALAAYTQRVLGAMHGGAVALLQAEAEKVAEEATAAWYGPEGVKRRTGKSGVVDVVTTVTPLYISVTIGSRDLDKAKYVHRPGPLSQLKRAATHADFKSGAAKASPKGDPIAGRGVVLYDNPKASDGKYLLQELVGKPARRIVKRINALLPTEIEARMRQGRSG